MTPGMLYDGILCIQGEAGIDLNGGGDRDVGPALQLIGEFERKAQARALREAAALMRGHLTEWLTSLANDVESGQRGVL